MKTRKLRLVSALLALAMLLAMVPVGAWAEDSSGSSAGTYIQIDDLAIDNDGFPYNPQYDKDSPNYRKGAHWSYSKDEYSSDLVFDISNEATIVLDLSSKTLNGKISANRLKLCGGMVKYYVSEYDSLSAHTLGIDGGVYDIGIIVHSGNYSSNQTSLTINDGLFKRTIQAYASNSQSNINDGVFEGKISAEMGSQITVNGGKFLTTEDGFYAAAWENNEIVIQGGIFAKKVEENVSSGSTHSITRTTPYRTVSITDGKFTATAEGERVAFPNNTVYTVGEQKVDVAYTGTTSSGQKFDHWEVKKGDTVLTTSTIDTVTIPTATEEDEVTVVPVFKSAKTAPSSDNFSFDKDTKNVTGKNGIADSDIESVVVKDTSGNSKTVTGNDLSKLDPGTYAVVSVTTKENDSFTAGTVTMPNTDAWKFTIKDTTTGGDDNNNNTTPDDGNNGNQTPTYPVSRGDYTEVTVTAPDGSKRDDDKAEKGDTVRVTLPEEDRKKGDMVFDGWDVIVEPEEKTADVLNELVKNGFKPGEPDTSFTMPELPEGTTLKFAPRYVTPDQSGSSDDSFLLTAAVVTGGAVVTGVVVYNVYARSYLKANLPESTALPQNREELALLLWNKAGCPAPADSPLYTDMDAADANAQAAARWAVENELLKPADKKDENVFKPEKSVSVGQVYRAWKKAEALNAQ